MKEERKKIRVNQEGGNIPDTKTPQTKDVGVDDLEKVVGGGDGASDGEVEVFNRDLRGPMPNSGFIYCKMCGTYHMPNCHTYKEYWN